MKYYALYDENDKLLIFGTTSAKSVVGEISETEYNELKRQHAEKVDYAQRVYAGEITIDDVPEEYRENVAAMVAEMQAAENEVDPEEISDAEALAIIQGVI